MSEEPIQPAPQDEYYSPMRNGDEFIPLSFGDDAKLMLQNESIQAAKRLWELREETTHDEQTGLFNRKGFQDNMQSWLDTADTGDIGLLFIDLDKFKAINDKMGHPLGDSFLASFGSWLQEFVRKDNGHIGDLVARIGGDEFAIGVRLKNEPNPVEKIEVERRQDPTEAEPTEQLDDFANRLYMGFKVFLSKHPAYRRIEGLGISIGGAIYESGMTLSQLTEIADGEMYEVKAKKKNSRGDG